MRADPVEGCDDLDITRRLFETIWMVDRDFKPRLVDLLSTYIPGRDYHHLTSLEDIADLTRRLIGD